MGLLLPISLIWSCRTYLHVRYGHKTQASYILGYILPVWPCPGVSSDGATVSSDPSCLSLQYLCCSSLWEGLYKYIGLKFDICALCSLSLCRLLFPCPLVMWVPMHWCSCYAVCYIYIVYYGYRPVSFNGVYPCSFVWVQPSVFVYVFVLCALKTTVVYSCACLQNPLYLRENLKECRPSSLK